MKIQIVAMIALGMFTSLCFSNEASYIYGKKRFMDIADVNRQAEAWGTCAAAYDVMALILKSQPAQAKQVKDYGNGASLAVIMTHVSDGLGPDITSDKFNALWNYSKTLGDSIPETKRNMMLAEAEALGEKGSSQFIEKVAATVKVCINNLKYQQVYIDDWRELAKSGLLQIPKG